MDDGSGASTIGRRIRGENAKLEQDGEDLNRMQALITAKKEARQCYRNSSARVRCHLTTINLPDFSPGFATVDSRCQEETQTGRTF